MAVSNVGGSFGYHFMPLPEFTNSTITEEDEKKIESDFYKGGPPQWLNFHTAEKSGSAFVRRDGFEKMKQKIIGCAKHQCTVTSVNLFHQSGSGGSTLAMQVLWDLRKKFRCAVLKGGTASSQEITEEVITLYKNKRPKTVLLLMDNLPDMHDFERILIQGIADTDINTRLPVVIILKCRRAANMRENQVHVQTKLSEEEQTRFVEKEMSIRKRHGEASNMFHGFNLMRHNFDLENVTKVTEATASLSEISGEKSKKHKLLSILALLNLYVPDFNLTTSDCQKYLGFPKSNSGDSSFDEEMQPFTHLLVFFSTQGKNNSESLFVRMCHPLIATSCIKAFSEADWKLSCITEDLLNYADKVEGLEYAVKNMLTKRGDTEEQKQQRFSQLILDIQEEGNDKCTSILKQASDIFKNDPFLPQTLARFHYIEKENFHEAEEFANEAKRRRPKNSFIADTLGQVHKNHLKKTYTEDAVGIAEKALDAFEEEEKRAEDEHDANLENDGMTKIYNNRGKFGYLQVVKTLCYRENQADENLAQRFSSLISSLEDKPEDKCRFFERFLTYSKISVAKDDPDYLRGDVMECLKYYAGKSVELQSPQKEIQELKKEVAASFPGILYCLEKKSNLQKITLLWDKVNRLENTTTSAQNYILANIALCCEVPASQDPSPLPLHELKSMLLSLLRESVQETEKSPEIYLLVLLLFWPEGEDGNPHQENDQDSTVENGEEEVSLDICETVGHMKGSFERTYSKSLRSRYLLPLFFLGNGCGLSRLVHKSKIDDKLKQTAQDPLNKLWHSGDVWKDENIMACLSRVKGKVCERKILACYRGKDIEVQPHDLASVRYQGDVSFYLGFNIKGPVAYDIKYQPQMEEATSEN